MTTKHEIHGNAGQALGYLHDRSYNGLQGEFSGLWVPHVLANFPFYTVLLPLFLKLTLHRLQRRPDSATRDALTILGFFEHEGFRNLLDSVEESLASYIQSSYQRADGQYASVMPFIHSQMQDWSAAARSGAKSHGLEVQFGNSGVRIELDTQTDGMNSLTNWLMELTSCSPCHESQRILTW